MSPNALDLTTRSSAALVGLMLLGAAWRMPRSRGRLACFLAVIFLGVLSFPGVDRWTRPLLHPQDQFHYVMGAKYFPELGYAGLYEATARVLRERGLPRLARVRDLRSGALISAEAAARRAEALPFRPERWHAFADDVAAFDRITGGVYLGALLDHGFNATPAWLAVARALVGDAPVTETLLYRCASFDLVLVGLLLFLFLRAFGVEGAALSVLMLGTGVVWRFGWVGASFLRYDWFVALGAALVALRGRRFALAGGLLAWASALRLFPAFLALTAGFSLLGRAGDRRGGLDLARFACGFVAVAAVAFVAGAAQGRGPSAWREFLERIRAHHAAWAENHVGLHSVAVFDAAFEFRRPARVVDAQAAAEAFVAAIEQRRRARRGALQVAFLVSLAAVAVAAWRLQPWQALALGVIPVFCATALSGYYWVMFVLVSLAAPRRTGVLLLLLAPLAAAVELATGSVAAAHIVVSAVSLAILLDWLCRLWHARAREARGLRGFG